MKHADQRDRAHPLFRRHSQHAAPEPRARRRGRDRAAQARPEPSRWTPAGRLNKAIALCREKSDNGSRTLLEEILVNEEEGIDWLEGQLHIVDEVGKENYLAEMIRKGDG